MGFELVSPFLWGTLISSVIIYDTNEKNKLTILNKLDIKLLAGSLDR